MFESIPTVRKLIETSIGHVTMGHPDVHVLVGSRKGCPEKMTVHYSRCLMTHSTDCTCCCWPAGCTVCRPFKEVI